MRSTTATTGSSRSATPTPTSPLRSDGLRVLHLRNASGYYGAERCIVAWMGAMASRGHSFHLAVYPHADPSTEIFIEEARASGAEVVRLPRAHARSLSVVGTLVRLVRRERIDVIHAHETRTHAFGWITGGITGRPVVGTLHGYVPSSEKARRLNELNRRFLSGKRLDGLTVPTTALARAIGGNATVMANAAPRTLADGSLAALDPPTRPTFGFVGRLATEKGVRDLLAVAADAPTGHRFVLIGEGPERAALASHPAAARVEWAGFSATAAEDMRTFTALVMPSHTEGVPITLLEAMAQGVPIVAASVGGIPEVVRDRVEALLVPPREPSALARALAEIVARPDEARARADAARKRFLAGYTLERVASDLESLYRSVAGRRA